MYGFMGKVLVIDLTTVTADVIEKNEAYYRKYLGGSLLCAKLFEEQLEGEEEVTPFSPLNPIVFAPGPLAGGGVCGATRVNIVSLSPETRGIFTAQSGGEFGPAIKRAGFDALVIKGRSAGPVYLRIDNDQVFFEEAHHLWGRDRRDTYDTLTRQRQGKLALATIGPAGENRVSIANIMFEPDHYAGRGGLGAVIGSKNLKAIGIQGDRKVVFHNAPLVKEINRQGAKLYKTAFQENPDGFLGVLRNYGTLGLLSLNQEAGNIPVNNFAAAHLKDEKAKKEITHPVIKEKFVGKRIPCKGCYLACKKTSRSDPEYTALAEYESIALLGPNLGLNDLSEGMEACELCNLLGIDTISAGTQISFLMDCFRNGLVDESEFDFSIHFGESEKIRQLIKKISYREGKLGNLLADGIETLAHHLGEDSRSYLRFSKGVGLPAHLPRSKPGIGFGYLHGPNPGDHMKAEHDWIATCPEELEGFNITARSELYDLDPNKAEIYRATQIYYSVMDCLSVCMFIFGPGNILSYTDIIKMVNAATGFDYSFDELTLIGERAVQLQKKLYTTYGGSDETLPAFMEEEIPYGPTKGNRIRRDDFESARKHYYALWEWDDEGKPIPSVLERLGI